MLKGPISAAVHTLGNLPPCMVWTPWVWPLRLWLCPHILWQDLASLATNPYGLCWLPREGTTKIPASSHGRMCGTRCLDT